MITFQIEFDKEKIENFEGLIATVRAAVLQVGREIVVNALNEWDKEISETRDKNRYRSKGKRKSCVKTWLGAIEYERNVYVDRSDPAHKRCVYLLDEEKEICRIGCVATDICEMAAQSVIEGTYRGAAKEITEMTGLSISAQGVWDIIQGIGETQRKRIERYAQEAEQNRSVGAIESRILYEENDGIWLNLQGKSREEYGPAKEMKVGIAYDGVKWEIGKNKQKRRTLNNKLAYAAFEGAAEFKRNKEGIVGSRFNVDEIELRVINGDGAQWIQKRPDVACISVLDKYHRNKKITECVSDKETAKCIRDMLYKGQTSNVMTYLEAMINSVEDPIKEAKLKELYLYYKNNRDALTDYYDRGIEIPPTREPGVIHHARLGSMESNVFTLIGNRMKGRRANWSINGANHLASILCAYHTTGMESIFGKREPLPQRTEKTIESTPFSAAKVQKKVGHGYVPEHTSTLPNVTWLKQISSLKPLSEI
ncbi:MAG: UPF0236 family protein [Clostridia bacterium]|nr:UPF0236 family protein [Clostridia bacterium]MBQ6421166.1 UPF0236 family protein [Clostridia bacterium]